MGEISETAIEEKNKQVRRAVKIVSHDKPDNRNVELLGGSVGEYEFAQ